MNSRKINLFITSTEFAACILIVIYLLVTNVMAHRNVFNSECYQEVDSRVKTVITNRGEFKWVTVTAYDLSVQSCGKLPTSRGYGITRSGKSLKGKSWKIRAIAVDPHKIKLGTKVRLTFSGWRSKYNGIYTAVDTGGAIKENRIDLFLGEGSYDECMKFGRVKAKMQILN